MSEEQKKEKEYYGPGPKPTIFSFLADVIEASRRLKEYCEVIEEKSQELADQCKFYAEKLEQTALDFLRNYRPKSRSYPSSKGYGGGRKWRSGRGGGRYY